MNELIIAVVGCWIVWVAFNLIIVLFAQRAIFTNNSGMVASASGIFSNSSIVLSPTLHDTLTGQEINAIFAHEHGHIVKGHIWENLLVVCFTPFLIPARAERRYEQEFEADDYAAGIIGAEVLASAILKLSNHRFDILRAERLAGKEFVARWNLI